MEAGEIIALVTLATGIIVSAIGGLFKVFDSRNTQQHAENKEALNGIQKAVDKVDQKLDDHITWHLDRSDARERAA